MNKEMDIDGKNVINAIEKCKTPYIFDNPQAQ